MASVKSKLNRIRNVDAMTGLQGLPDNSVDGIITSPPYFQQRDYGSTTSLLWPSGSFKCHKHAWGETETVKKYRRATASRLSQYQTKAGSFATQSKICHTCKAWHGQLGQEPDIDLYIQHLLQIFEECQRVLKPDGVLWLNISDGYAKKSLLGIPEKLVLGLLKQGWYLRNKIVWHKPNAAPHPTRGRLKCAWEPVFLLARSKRYQFNIAPVKVPCVENPKATKNPGDVWSICTRSNPQAHFAVFPDELVERMVKTSPEGAVILDPFMGSGTVAKVAQELGRDFIGFEPNPKYVKIAEKKLHEVKVA